MVLIPSLLPSPFYSLFALPFCVFSSFFLRYFYFLQETLLQLRLLHWSTYPRHHDALHPSSYPPCWPLDESDIVFIYDFFKTKSENLYRPHSQMRPPPCSGASAPPANCLHVVIWPPRASVVLIRHCCFCFLMFCSFFVVFFMFFCTFVGVLLFFFCDLGYGLLAHLKSGMLVETFLTGFRSSSLDSLQSLPVFLQQQPSPGGCCLY
jgi:hypothetical protein